MKTLEQIKQEVLSKRTFRNSAYVSTFTHYELEEISERYSDEYAKEVAHIIVNDALVKHGIGSNTSAEFVNKWVENNLPKHR